MTSTSSSLCASVSLTPRDASGSKPDTPPSCHALNPSSTLGHGGKKINYCYSIGEVAGSVT